MRIGNSRPTAAQPILSSVPPCLRASVPGRTVRLTLALPLAAALILAAGCGFPAVHEDRAAFSDGYAAFEAGKWQRAVDSFDAYLGTAPESARGEVRLRNREAARTDFQQAVDAKPPQPVAAYAEIALGNLYYEEGNDQRAVECYAEAIKTPPKDMPLDQVLLRLGVSLQRTGRWAAADRYFGHLVDRYPGTPAAVEAARRIHATAFTVQTGAFSSMITAQEELNRLRARGFDGRLTKTLRGSQQLYAVQVGRFAAYPAAAATARQLVLAGFQAMIVP